MNSPAGADFVLPAGWWRADQKWREQAACLNADTELFYRDSRADDEGIKQAKAICFSCPVREDCLQYALDSNERFGIWGGYTSAERITVLRGRRLRSGLREVRAGPTRSTPH